MSEPRFINLDDHNDETDDQDPWEDDDFWGDGSPIDECPWCGSATCSKLDNDGNLFCMNTGAFIP